MVDNGKVSTRTLIIAGLAAGLIVSIVYCSPSSHSGQGCDGRSGGTNAAVAQMEAEAALDDQQELGRLKAELEQARGDGAKCSARSEELEAELEAAKATVAELSKANDAARDAENDILNIAIGQKNELQCLDKRKAQELFVSLLPKHAECVEVGVREGTLSKKVVRIANPKHYTLVDPWIHWESGPFQQANDNKGQEQQDQKYEDVRAYFEDYDNVDIIRAKSEEAAAHFEDETIDWIYIDACHWASCVVADFAAWAPKVKMGGMMCGDDYTATIGKFKDGVIRGVNKNVDTGNFEFIVVMAGQYCVKKVGNGVYVPEPGEFASETQQ